MSESKPSDEQAVKYIAAALLIGASAQATAKTLAPMLAVPASVLSPLLLLALSKALAPPPTRPSTAVQISDEEEAGFRAGWVWAATKRILGGGDLADEKDYFNQHMDAGRNRHQRALEVDRAAERYGLELGWHARMDARTSEECRQANGRNFYADRIPSIGYPGTVHPHCRCKPGRPYDTDRTVYEVRPRRAA